MYHTTRVRGTTRHVSDRRREDKEFDARPKLRHSKSLPIAAM